MGLRENIADAVYDHPGAPAIINAVMEVVEIDQDRRRAYTERRVELARKAEAAKWERRMREEKEEADAIIAEEQARVREVEEENQKLRDDLEHATAFWFGPLGKTVIVDREASLAHEKGYFWVVRHPVAPEQTFDDVCAALSRARQLKESE